MEEYYTSDIILKDSGLIYQHEGRSKRIRITNPAYDRPIKLFLLITAVLSVLSLLNLNIEWIRLLSRIGDLGGVFLDLAKFNFVTFDMTAISFAESVAVTILATAYSLVNGLVMGAFMARNITPSKKLSTALSAFNSFVRAVPTMIWVLLVLSCLGFGPAPGIIGLSFHASAFFARAFSQAFEEVPIDVIEALKAAGANRIQIFFSSVLPASLTALIAWGALRFEINFSESAILGMVGAGGIGFSIAANMSSYNFGRAGIAILMVFTFAFSLEIIFTIIKRKIKI